MNRTILSGFCLLLAMFIAETACAMEKYYLIEVQNHARMKSYSIMTPEELKTLEASVRNEEKYFRKALAEAEKEWKADETNGSTAFPRAAVNEVVITKVGSFTDKAKADEKLAYYEERLVKDEEKDAARLEAKYTIPNLKGNKQKSLGPMDRDVDWRTQGKGKVDKERLAAAKEKISEKEELYMKALNLFEMKLAELITAAGTQAPAI